MKKMFAMVILLASAGYLWAQTAAEMDALLASDQVDFQTAARFVLPAAGLMGEDGTAEAGFALAQERGWIPSGAEAGSPIRLDEFSYLCVEAFSLPTGFLYKGIRGPRYAYRELVFGKYIQGRSDPHETLAGDRLVRILGRILDRTGGDL